jgi:hypothetical protein
MSAGGDGFGAAGEELMRAGRALLDGLGKAAEALGGAAGSGSGAGAGAGAGAEATQGTGAFGALAEAQVAFLTAGLGYGGRLAELYAARAPRLAEPLLAGARAGGLGDAEKLALAEEARAYLREVGEITAAEARGFARALAEIDAKLQAQVGGAQDETPRRRWRAKD